MSFSTIRPNLVIDCIELSEYPPNSGNRCGSHPCMAIADGNNIVGRAPGTPAR